MISVPQALALVKENSLPSNGIHSLSVSNAFGWVLAKDVLSPISMPPFRQSAMDGYALNSHQNTTYEYIGEVKAGDADMPVLLPGQAIRIFTGAAVPDSANAVVMQEKVQRSENTIVIESEVKEQENIRPKGEQVLKGQVALSKGTRLTAAGIGFLSSLGIQTIEAYAKPSIGIVVTGNELVTPGKPLGMGQIYESNAIMLEAALTNLGYSHITHYKVEDNYQKTLNMLSTAIEKNDVLIVSGGISVGDYDFVGRALTALKVNTIFYKVKQKPGKPLLFASHGKKLIFALPGNPGAALTCFYNYVQMALERISGNTDYQPNMARATLLNSFVKKGERAQFLKANYSDGSVQILEGQNSSMLHTFALANALIIVPEEVTELKAGQEVQLMLLPNT